MAVPLLLAPMAELSNRVLRELIENFGGCDEYFTEMISAAGLLAGGPFEKWYVDANPRPEKTVFQLVGSDSTQISQAAAILDKLECAGIDINMGCSAPIIRKNGAGAAWMGSVDRASELISKIKPNVKHRLSVKLRLGYKDDFDYLVNFCRKLENEGVELITLHPRLITEKFKRFARWEYVEKLRQELRIPVAGNGDAASAENIIKRANGPCDAVMVGRAAIRQPWIFRDAVNLQTPVIACRNDETAAGEGTSIVKKTGLRFLELLSRYQPPEFHISRARRFFSYFCDNLKWGSYMKNKINREESLSGIEKVWLEYFITNLF
ncbi:MAG: tRNA-dihydrouridine synthase family protein [Treponema sp.]|jgi:tRNA-dihydrouridine synthase|nr:tRNA-dihydrouridine synthase family protein [Treponema sp.]